MSHSFVSMWVWTSIAGAVLYGSDYPHTIGDMAGDKVRGRKAERIFRL